jgi:hypothetical protein
VDTSPRPELVDTSPRPELVDTSPPPELLSALSGLAEQFQPVIVMISNFVHENCLPTMLQKFKKYVGFSKVSPISARNRDEFLTEVRLDSEKKMLLHIASILCLHKHFTNRGERQMRYR